MMLVQSLGAILKYELAHLFGKTTAVMVELTPQEWSDFQAAAAADTTDLGKLAQGAVKDAHVVAVPATGKVAVQLKAGDYSALHTAHAEAKAAEPTEAKAEEPKAPEPAPPADPPPPIA